MSPRTIIIINFSELSRCFLPLETTKKWTLLLEHIFQTVYMPVSVTNLSHKVLLFFKKKKTVEEDVVLII